jgi:hypothetical protein
MPFPVWNYIDKVAESGNGWAQAWGNWLDVAKGRRSRRGRFRVTAITELREPRFGRFFIFKDFHEQDSSP